MPKPIETLTLDLGPRSYDILTGPGLLGRLSELLLPDILAGRIAVITDETVARLHLDTLNKGLGRAPETSIIVRPGETSKCFNTLESVLDELLQAGFSRSDTLIAFGGGVVGDLTGFAASVLKRGCRFVQIPTTLLAQVDSSVGGKTAINTKAGKNLVGAFYQPAQVIIDTDVLATLEPRQMRAGYAEVLKYGLIDKPDFFDWLETHAQDILSHAPEALTNAITTSCAAKAAIVARDEREHGERALLNLGHTFAHALEAAAGYDGRILHGEAVSAGMLMAFEYSQLLGLCPGQDVSRVRAHVERMDMPTPESLVDLLEVDATELVEFMRRDKKNTGTEMTMILTRGIGKSFIARDVNTDTLFQYLKGKTGA